MSTGVPLCRTAIGVITFAALSGSDAHAQVGGLGVYEVASPGVGHAYAGMAADASDASIAYFNPAAMGLQWRALPIWKLQTGFSYDSSPVEADKRTPDLPTGAY